MQKTVQLRFKCTIENSGICRAHFPQRADDSRPSYFSESIVSIALELFVHLARQPRVIDALGKRLREVQRNDGLDKLQFPPTARPVLCPAPTDHKSLKGRLRQFLRREIVRDRSGKDGGMLSHVCRSRVAWTERHTL
jgi:hypothetical protein